MRRKVNTARNLGSSATFTTEIVKYFGLSEPELRMFWENANSFLLYAMGCSQVAQWPSKRYKACENSLVDSYASCMRNSTLFDMKNNPECKYFLYYFECIIDRVRGVSRGPVHWGSVFCRSPSEVTLHPFSFDLHRSSTAIDIKREK